MEISKTIQPGEMGTKSLLNEYGDRLVCVRYRTDKKAQKRYTTVEIIVSEKSIYIAKNNLYVWINIHYNEVELRLKAKNMGAKWQPEEKCWEMEYQTAKSLNLLKRIIKKTVK